MASNVLVQNSSIVNSNQRIMDSMNGNINVENDKSVVSKTESNDDNLSHLMERLHSKSSQMKSWPELAKIMKQSLNEKRHVIDINERNQLQKFLDTIQKNIRVTSLQSMVERLETICRQLGLKFVITSSTKGVECFVHSEMYYVEVLLELSSGHVLDCKVAHQADALSCPELTEVLQKGDFVEFTKHLEGLSAIYQINADKKNKTKAYLALHALEIDLSSLAELQNHQINDINNLVHKSPVGILEPRKGGHPMKLTYFVPPYDLIDLSTKSSLPLTVDVILEKKLGYSATICIESSSSHRLQHESLINTLKTPEGKNLPQFSALTNLNSTQLPACFVLKLQKPLVTSIDILRKITAVTTIEFSYELISKREPLISLIAKQLFSSQSIAQLPNTPFYVKLPNQQHCYHLNESCDKLDGVIITSIPITHPTHVPRILVHLRQQVLFNVIIGSFIRQTSKPEDITNIFEVTTTSMSNINIQFEHPTEESLATVDLDLRDVTNVKCKLYPTSSLSSFCSDDYASKVMQRCLSIPVTMRSIINKCKERAAALKEQMAKEQAAQMQLNQNELYFSSLNSANGTMDSSLGGRQPSLSYLTQQLQQYNSNGSVTQHQQLNQQFIQSNNQLQGQQQNLQRFFAQKMQQHLNQEGMQNNRSQLSLQQLHQQQHQLLQQQNQMIQQPQQQTQQQQNKQNAMLMSMLSDIPAANTQMALNLLKQQQQQQHLQQLQMQQQMQYMQQQQQPKPKKQRKRKATNDNMSRSPASSTGKSPKRKLSDDDIPDDCMTAENTGFQWNSETPNACRSNATLASTVSYTDAIGNIKQELNMSGETTPTYSFLNQRLPFPINQTANEFNDFAVNDLPLYGETGGDGVMSDIKGSIALGINQALISAKTVNKRTTKRMKSDGSDDTSGTGDEGHNEQQRIIKSLEDLHQKDDFSKFLLNKDSVGICVPDNNNMKKSGLTNIKLSKTVNKGTAGDGRRCSSAGIESGGPEIKRSAIMTNNDDIVDFNINVKKERKRKRAESVDSLKASTTCATSTTGRNANSANMSSESSMMPPPMVGSVGDVTSSSCSLSFMEMGNIANKAIVPNVNIKMMASSTSPSSSQTVMKISSTGKKSIISANVSSTSGNENKVSKSLSNKLEKNSTLSSMLKNQRQGYSVSPKISDSESNANITPSQSTKGLSFKSSKSKTSKSGLNSSAGRAKDHSNKSQLLAGLKQKSGNISSTSSLSSSKLGSMAVSSSSSLSPSLSSGPTSSLVASSVTSSKQQQQQQQLQLQQQLQQQQQQSGKLAKISRKGSLSGIVDQLTQKAAATGFTPGQNAGPNEGGRPESSSLSTNRPDTTSVPKVNPSGSNKLTESKTKYSRSSDQFTIKQSNSGGPLKMSITKTKLSGIESSNKIGPGGTGLFKNTTTSKFTIPKLPKTASSASARPTSASSSPLTTSTSSSVSSASPNSSVKRQMSTNKVTTGSMKSPASVSSSTHPTSVSLKGSTSSAVTSISHQNKNTFADRLNVKIGNSNPSPNKNAALTKILGDKFKPTSEPSSTTKTNQNESPSSNTTTTSFGANNKTATETTRASVYSKFDGATVPMPVVYSRSLSASGGNISPQLPASTTSVQSNKPIYSKSVSVNESENIDKLTPNWTQQQESSITDSINSDKVERNINSNNNIRGLDFSAETSIEKAGVSSSSDVKASTSTPSSPAEMTLMSDAFQNPPPLIPTEAIDDESEPGSGSLDVNGECENSSSIAIDSSESAQECRTSLTSTQICSTVSTNDTFNEVSTSENARLDQLESVDSGSAVTQSRRESIEVSESKKVVVDEDEEADGLVIDEPSVQPKPNRGTTATTREAVSSSTSRQSSLNGSQSPNKSSSSPISSSVTPPLNTTPPLPVSSITGTAFGSVTSPSNHSTTSSIQRPSPYPIADIDDELMDEALVGSAE